MAEDHGRPKIEIKTKEGTSGVFTEIYVDGHKLRGVRRAVLTCEGGFNKIPTLTLDLNALDITADGEWLVRQEGYGEIGITFKEKEGE